MTDRDATPTPEEQLLRLLGGKWIAAAVSAAATLGLADALESGPRGAAELATALRCHEPSLRRLLGALASLGVLDVDDHGRYRTTELGVQLRADALGPLARYVGSPAQWAPWSLLPETIRTGRSAFASWHGEDLFEHLDTDPDAAALYHDAVDAFTRRQARELARVFDFTECRHVVDVGGGMGTLVREVLRAWPHLEGTLYDRPTVAEAARLQSGAGDDPGARVRFVGGDFFESVPSGADVYVVKHVLHNWGDDDATTILRACTSAGGPRATVLVIESVLLPGTRPDATRLLDLEMLALCRGGHERSKPQLRALLANAGLRIERTAPLVAGTRLLVATAAPGRRQRGIDSA